MVLLTGCLAISGCTKTATWSDIRAYCAEKPAICALIGAAIVGGAVAASRHWDDDDDPAPAPAVSDIRLKHAIKHVETLDNGIRLHAFKYKNDDRYFVGVLAQELLDDTRFSDAAMMGTDGYYRVDYHCGV